MGLLELLQAGDVDGFNDARGTHGRVELVAEELAGLVLRGADLAGAVLDKSDLTETDLTDANLVRASLSDIDGSGAILDGVLAMHARLRDAWLEDADLTGADFSDGDLAGAHLERTKGEGLRLLRARLKEAQAREASWPLADLSEAGFKGADLTGADLTRARLAEAKGGGATLERAKLDGADAVNLKLGGAKCAGASFRGAKLTGAHLAGADLTGADLREVDLTRANLTGATLDGADLRGAILVDASLDQVDLSTARVEDADLTGVDITLLGIGEEAAETLAGHGARFDPDAPLVFDDAATAVRRDEVAVCWLNPDAADVTTLRWAWRRGADEASGILPVSGASVLFHAVVAAGDAFRLIALVDRPDGATLMTWPLREGAVAPPATTPLGYEPAVLPVVRAEDDCVLLWGLARRGPTIVLHRDALDGAGFQPVHSEARPQARGFVGRSHPVLVCKGGVAMAVERSGLGPPRRTPDGFQTRVCTAAPLEDRLVAVWNTPVQGRDPGGLRWLELGARGASDPELLTKEPNVNGIDAVPDGDAVLVAWTEDEGDAGGRAWWVRLPGGAPQAVEVPQDALDQVRVVRDAADGAALLTFSTLAGRLRVHRLTGEEVAVFEDGEG